MSSPSLVIVVVEDEHHKMLIYRYLVKCKLKGNEIRIQQSPSGRGSAEHWVRKEFVKEVIEYRKRQARAGTALVVMIDADTRTVRERLARLDQALTDSGRQPVGETEQIARLIPKRNVETWILCLNEQAVNEETDYTTTRNDWNELIPPGAETLYGWTRPNIEPPGQCVSSLRAGVLELKRLRT